MAWRFAAAGDALTKTQRAVTLIDGEDDERIFTPIAGVEEIAGGGDRELRSGVDAVEAGVDGADGMASAGKHGLRFNPISGAHGGVEVLIQTRGEFVDSVGPALVGMKGQVARSGTRRHGLKEAGIAEARGAGVDGEDGDIVVAEIVHDDEAIIRREHGGVGVRSILPRLVGTGMAEYSLVVEVDTIDGLRERAVIRDAVAGDCAASVVGDVGGVPAAVDRDVARAFTAGGDLVEQGQRSGGRIELVGGDGGGLGVAFVAGVEQVTLRLVAGGNLVEREICRAQAGGCKNGRGELTFVGIEAREVDSLGGRLVSVGAEEDERLRQWSDLATALKYLCLKGQPGLQRNCGEQS